MGKIEIREHPKHSGVFVSGSPEKLKLYSKNLIPGRRVYGEKLVEYKEVEYREWDPYRSKLAAMILGNPSSHLFSPDLSCLYLGASSGTTLSHLSDILFKGVIYGVEFAERSMRQLIQNVALRNNVIPILGDGNFPESFAEYIFSSVDFIYQDVAQPNQAEIAVKNGEYYLKDGGIIIIAIKSQSIDSIQKSEKVYAREKSFLESRNYEITETLNINKYAANHIAFITKKGIST